jgi:diadenosine tetraphosphatase ApaH/serine/threonine PP2A family protein phosphatase
VYPQHPVSHDGLIIYTQRLAARFRVFSRNLAGADFLKRFSAPSVDVIMSDISIKYAVLGDIHANSEALTAVLADARDQGCTHYACVGDIVGYNASPRQCLELVRSMGMPCVKGNHDELCATDGPLHNVNPRAAAAILWTRQQLGEADKQWLKDLGFVRFVAGFSLVHASLDAPQRWGYVLDRLTAAASLNYQTTSVCFYGHTHLPMTFIRDGGVHGGTYSKFRVEAGRKYLVNVGSVGEPRDGNPLAAYVTYEFATGEIELRRVAYDFGKTQAEAVSAGLTPQRVCNRGLNNAGS